MKAQIYSYVLWFNTHVPHWEGLFEQSLPPEFMKKSNLPDLIFNI